jgi:hypothetical protein
LHEPSGHSIKIDGLWSIAFGTAVASNPSTLYFTAGSNGEVDGLFGSLQAIPRDHDHDD